ncbi:hypothetical protein [Pendulispora albinea]|uniref:Uncharacterized protein n=1 Tax=Pendulispora albinea TaxID=2741071 RepID=A0ABZ2MAJ9_9BACT
MSAQTVLEDLTIDLYDALDDPLHVTMRDLLPSGLLGAKPITTEPFSYDDQSQLRRVEYSTGDDVHVSPFADEASAFCWRGLATRCNAPRHWRRRRTRAASFPP